MVGLLPSTQLCRAEGGPINTASEGLAWEHSQEASNFPRLKREAMTRDRGPALGQPNLALAATSLGLLLSSDGPGRSLDRLSKLKAYPFPFPMVLGGL